MLLLTLLISFAINLFFFAVASRLKTDKFTDITYALTFIAIAIYSYSQGSQTGVQFILLLLICLWAFRLGSFLLYRVIILGKDKRFDNMREDFLAFLKFWILQAATVWFVMLPSTLALSYSDIILFTHKMFYGTLIWAIGLTIETLADHQKFSFKQDPANSGRWTNAGLYKYSRYPNYFGEITLWWGIFIYTLPYLSGSSIFAIIGPVFITLLITKVSGIPLLEKGYAKRYKNNKSYAKYVKSTRLLLPIPKFN